MTQQEFLDAIRALLEGPDWAGDVILRRDLNGEEKRRRGASHFAAALRQIMGQDTKKNPPAGFV